MKQAGPGFLVAAAFIGPGTVTTATLAGANFGYALLWAVLFSIFATIILQGMAARLGVLSGHGLAENLRLSIEQPIAKFMTMLLVVAGIGIGNAAYEAGNLTGAAIGLYNLMGGSVHVWAGSLGVVALLLMLISKQQLLMWLLTALVGLMSLVFITTLVIASPNLTDLFTGLFIPSLPNSAVITTLALVGTTVVPYNLFLHTSLCASYRQDLSENERLRAVQKDNVIAVCVGGLITLAIIATAATTFFAQQLTPTIDNIAMQLEPLLGSFAPTFFAIGLFAAGLTSAITAPLAASYALCGVFGWETKPDSRNFKIVWFTILVVGICLCFLQIKPLELILLAQVANSLLLPLLAGLLLWIVNKASVMGTSKNSRLHNSLAGVVIAVLVGLSSFKLYNILLN